MTRKLARAGRQPTQAHYADLLADISGLLETARRASARTTNALMTATYWLVGRHIVEFEQRGQARADYGEQLVRRLSKDLSGRFGRGFGLSHLKQVKAFYLAYPDIGRAVRKGQTASGQSPALLPGLGGDKSIDIRKGQTPSGLFMAQAIAARFPLPWSAYVRLLAVQDDDARSFYEAEAMRGGWSVRQLDRQIDSMFYERTALSRNKTAMLKKGEKPRPGDALSPDEEIKDPYILEFLGLKDEYSETELEDALIRHLESFLMELGGDFAFVGRQRRLRIDDEWYRVDLLFFHRRLRCLVVIDLKLGKFTHADVGQMHLYLNYARKHWMAEGENPPVGIVLCSATGSALARYALDNLPNKILARQYHLVLPAAKRLAAEIRKTRQMLERRRR